MGNDRTLARIELVGIVLSLLLLVLGVAELTGAVDFFPVRAYLLVLWLIAVFLWAIRRE